jgi:hypothetical protein
LHIKTVRLQSMRDQPRNVFLVLHHKNQAARERRETRIGKRFVRSCGSVHRNLRRFGAPDKGCCGAPEFCINSMSEMLQECFPHVNE